MTHLDLFSGIGGFALAASWAGIDTVAFCEIEDFPRKVLEKNFPNIPIHRDVRDLNGQDYRGIGIITGGYPCQPFSCAGNRKGKEDYRYIWPEMLRVITQSRPTWVLCENVVGHVTLGLDKTITDLENEGYTTRTFIIPALAVDASHQRNRVWIVAHTGSKANNKQSTLGKNSNNMEKSKETIRSEYHRIHKFNIQQYADELFESVFVRNSNGIPNRMDRTKSLGNAIVPQVAYEIMKAILEADKEFTEDKRIDDILDRFFSCQIVNSK